MASLAPKGPMGMESPDPIGAAPPPPDNEPDESGKLDKILALLTKVATAMGIEDDGTSADGPMEESAEMGPQDGQ